MNKMIYTTNPHKLAVKIRKRLSRLYVFYLRYEFDNFSIIETTGKINELKRILCYFTEHYSTIVSMEDIEKRIKKYYPSFDRPNSKRHHIYREPRQIAHYLSRRFTKESLSSIGEYFGQQDHATVLNSIKKVSYYIETEKDFRDKLNKIQGIFE